MIMYRYRRVLSTLNKRQVRVLIMYNFALKYVYETRKRGSTNKEEIMPALTCYRIENVITTINYCRVRVVIMYNLTSKYVYETRITESRD